MTAYAACVKLLRAHPENGDESIGPRLAGLYETVTDVSDLQPPRGDAPE